VASLDGSLDLQTLAMLSKEISCGTHHSILFSANLLIDPHLIKLTVTLTCTTYTYKHAADEYNDTLNMLDNNHQITARLA